MKEAAFIFAAVIIMGLIAFACWQLARQWNYSWGYESMVRETVCDMVKPEHLKEKCE